MKSHVLEVGKRTLPETWKRPGKVESSDYVNVVIPRHYAWEVVQSLLQQLRETPEVKDLTYSFFGELSNTDEAE